MLTKATLRRTAPLESLVFDLANPYASTNGLILKSISGLSPADVTLFKGDFSRHGGYYQGRRVGERPVNFNFRLEPNYTSNVSVSDLREKLYEVFYQPEDASDGLFVVLEDDKKPNRELRVYTEKWQGDIFSQDTSVTINTIMVDPFLVSSVETVQSALNTFSLPFEYIGSADAGFKISLEVVAETTGFRIELGPQFIEWDGSLAAGDILVVNTIPGQQGITKNGVNVLGGMTAESDWMVLKPKPSGTTQTITSHGATVGDNLVKITEFRYFENWWGV